MKLGDLVKVKCLSADGPKSYGIITGTYIRGFGKIKVTYWNVFFASINYQVPFLEKELELISAGR